MTRNPALRKQPLQERSRATVETVIEATVQVLLREGGAGLTTTKVAARAGVSVGTLYQYFPDKQSLVAAVYQRYLDLTATAVGEAMREACGADPAETSDAAIAALIDVKRRHIDLSRALNALPTKTGRIDAGTEIVDHFGQILELVVQEADLKSDPARRRRRTRSAVAAVEGILSYVLKAEPAWLDAPWIVPTLQAVARAALKSE